MVSARNTPIIRRLAAHEGPLYREVRLRALADSPDAYGSTLEAEQARSADDWAWRLTLAATSGKDHPLIAQHDGAAVGLAWGKVDAGDATIVNVFQVWVAPECRGQGVAAMLLREVVRWAKDRNTRVVQLGVTCGDTPARRLYLREGFEDYGQPELRRPDSPLREQAMRLILDESLGLPSPHDRTT